MIFDPSAIVWDLDGTLIDSAADLAQALNALLVDAGHPAIAANRVRPMIGDGVEKLIERGFAAAGETLSQSRQQSLIRRFISAYTDCATDNTRLYPGARLVLQHFADAGVRQGLCTNKPESISRKIIANLLLTDFFAAVVGGDTTETKKPNPLPLRSCIFALDVTPERSVMIGDSAIDVATARAAGVGVGLVSHGYSRTDVATLGADFVVDQLPSVTKILGRSPIAFEELSCSRR